MIYEKDVVPPGPREIWLAAMELVAAERQRAPQVAARRARICLEIGAMRERRTWLHILAATKALSDLAPEHHDDVGKTGAAPATGSRGRKDQ